MHGAGGDLQGVLEAARRTGHQPKEAAFVRRVLFAVGGALAYIHSQGVLHRDVKPSNVLLTSEEKEIRLADFGISKILEATQLANTGVGTPFYLSPEIVRGGNHACYYKWWVSTQKGATQRMRILCTQVFCHVGQQISLMLPM